MKLYLTNAGQELLYKAQGGKTLKFTRFGLGDGELNGQAIQPLTNLVNEKMQADLKKLEIKNNKVIVGMSFSNSELTDGFYFRELGLFAENPDTSEEILYMYANFGETSEYIDAYTGKAIEENLDVEIYVSDVENITAIIDSSLVYATKQELTEIESNIEEITADISDLNIQLNGLHRVATSGDYNDLNNIPIRNDIPYVRLYDDGGSVTDNLTEEGIYRIKTLSVNSVLNSMFNNAIIHRYTSGGGSTFIMILASSNKALNNYGYYAVSKTNGVWNIEYSKIPIKTSELTNDSGFKKITASTTDLTPGSSPLAIDEVYLTYE